MSRRRVANPLALAVLSCLWERPMYPYEMTTSLRERGKEDSIRLNFGSLYAVIKSLEKHRLIEATHTEREGNRPERIVYAITPEGRDEADEWLRELLSVPVKEYPAFETGLSLLPMLPPVDATELLRGRVERLDTDLRARAAQRVAPDVAYLPELFLVEFDYRVAMLQAEREFVAGLVARLASGEFGGLDMWAQMHEAIAQGQTPAELAAKFDEYVAGLVGKEAPGPPA